MDRGRRTVDMLDHVSSTNDRLINDDIDDDDVVRSSTDLAWSIPLAANDAGCGVGTHMFWINGSSERWIDLTGAHDR